MEGEFENLSQLKRLPAVAFRHTEVVKLTEQLAKSGARRQHTCLTILIFLLKKRKKERKRKICYEYCECSLLKNLTRSTTHHLNRAEDTKN